MFTDQLSGCVSWLCPCVVWGQNKTRLEYLEKTGMPHPDGGESFGNDCKIHGLLTICGGWGWILQIGTRASTRDRYHIEGSPFKDCFSAWCCHACELTQESRELEIEEQSLRAQQGTMRDRTMREPKPEYDEIARPQPAKAAYTPQDAMPRKA